MADITIRGYRIKVQAKEGRQREFVRRQFEQRTNVQLAEYERDFYPDRAIVREALEAVYGAEEKLRFLLMDQLEAAEAEAAKDPDFIPDYINDEGDELLYPENVNPELDSAIFKLFEAGLELRGILDGTD